MNQKKTDVRLLAQMALLVALELVLAFTPLGYIPLGFMNATTMHIPVILGACLLGPKMGGVLGAVLIVAIVPRVLIGVIAGLVFQFIMRISHDKLAVALPVAGFVGSMVNTIGVMGLIYLLFGEQYAAAGGQSFDLLLGVIMGVVAVNGVPEALIAAVLTLAVGKVLIGIFGRRGAKTAQQGTV